MINTFEYIVNTSKDYISLINKEYRYIVVNDAYCTTLGLKREQILNKTVAELWGENKFANLIKPHFDKCFSGEEVHCIEKFRFGDMDRYMHVVYYPYIEEHGITHVLVFSHDISKVKEIEERLIDFEFKDLKTGLYNRKSLEIVLDIELDKSKRQNNNHIALMLINLENFNKINKIYGYDIGDILLENTGIRIKNSLRNSDYVFRFEGDEIVVILSTITKDTHVLEVARKIYNSISIPYNYKEQDIIINSHIGISISPNDGKTKEELLRKAIFAVSEAKRLDDKYLIFDENLHKQAIDRLEIEKDLQKAFQEEQLELYFQPIVNMKCKIVGAEALIRWNHPVKGLVPPMDFIPIAQESNLIISIGKWALFEVCKKLEKWTKEFDIYISVNLTPREFENPNLLEIIENATKNHHSFDTKHLKLEITETESMKNYKDSCEKIKILKNMGIDVLVDDFGIGHSSLSYLKHLPVATIKIDKAFVDNITESDSEIEFLTGIIDIIKSREKDIIIEGVATKEQYEILKKLDCNKMQGYYFSRPVREPIFEEMLKKGVLP